MPRPLTVYHPNPAGYYYTTNTNPSPPKEKFLIGFFIAIIVVLILLICCCVRFSSRSRRQVGSNAATATATASAACVVSSENIRSSSQALAPLPIFVYNSTSHVGNRECVVCLMDFTMGEKCRFLPECGHSFHVGCVDMWLHSHSTCPLCRASVTIQQSELPI